MKGNNSFSWIIESWNVAHAIFILIASFLSIAFNDLCFLAFGGIFSFLGYILLNFRSLNQLIPFAGYANWVTGLRLLLFLMFLLSVFDYENKLMCFAVINIILISDLIDGFLARKYNQETSFGQYFDMEVDAFWVCGMCIYYFQYHEIGLWILVPGFLRYMYKLFLFIYPKKEFKETRKRYAAIIAGAFFAILSISLLLDGITQAVLLGLGATMICISFFISTVEYIRF